MIALIHVLHLVSLLQHGINAQDRFRYSGHEGANRRRLPAAIDVDECVESLLVGSNPFSLLECLGALDITTEYHPQHLLLFIGCGFVVDL